jgi:hypothetical protein
MQKNSENVRFNTSLNDIVRMSQMFNGHDALKGDGEKGRGRNFPTREWIGWCCAKPEHSSRLLDDFVDAEYLAVGGPFTLQPSNFPQSFFGYVPRI